MTVPITELVAPSILTERDALIASLKSGNGIHCYGEELACYPTHDSWFYVDYFFSEDTINKLNLTERERKIAMDEEELIELFETPEEAIDFYLRVRNGGGNYKYEPPKKRTVKQKVKKSEQDMFF